MQVILKPLSHPELGDIVIAEQLFPIGRSEAPFSSYEQQVVAHLSRRHARIFREGQGIYVADLGSRNGTRLNDKSVKFKPARLLAGDRLTLANQLDYEVAIETGSEDANPVATASLALNLLPAETNSGLEPIAINCFPYLIGKADPAFSGAVFQGADRRDYLSRRHAHIYASGDALYIEDLGSTNGTCLNGERLDEHAHPLADGDLLLFGGGYFSYRVMLKPPAIGLGDGEAPKAPVSERESHTIMVSSADSFLEIFCVDPEEVCEAEDEDEAESAAAKSSDHTPGAGPARPGPLHRIKTFSSELRAAFGDDKPASARWQWIAVCGLVLAGVIALGVYYNGKPRRDVEALLAQERFLEAARLSAAQLSAEPDDAALGELATEAMVRYMVSDWLAFSGAGDFPGAQSFLSEVRPLTVGNPEAGSLLDMLAWLTRLQQFIVERGGVEAPIRIYEHEEQIRELVDWWNLDPEKHRSHMALLLAYVSEFKATHAQAFSQLRTLRNEQSVYLGAIDKLDAIVERHLTLDQPEKLVQEIDSFVRQYPRLGGTDRLQGDLDYYLQVHEALRRDDQLRAAMLLDEAEFLTPPFAQHAERLQATLLPSGNMARQYGEASAAWRDGDLAMALGILEALAAEPAGELAAGELQRKRKIIDDYARLQQYRDNSDYGERVLGFYRDLNPAEDVHFTRALELEFQRHSTAARAEADLAWQQAASNWGDYREDGGIRGLLRLEEEVSARFDRQAGLLSAAYNKAGYATQVYDVLGLDSPPEYVELSQQVTAEMALQRRSLEQLSMVLNPEILNTKLRLLASTPMDAQ